MGCLTFIGEVTLPKEPEVSGIVSLPVIFTQPPMEDASVTVTENGIQTIRPSEGFEGLKSVEITTDVQPPLEAKVVSIPSSQKSVTVIPSEGFYGMSKATVNVEDEDEWKPNPTWWDVEAILNEDTEDVGDGGKAIFLMTDSDVSTVFKFGYSFTKIKTSDGAIYTADATHTWDSSKDKQSDSGYKTRYVIGYTTKEDKDFSTFARVNLYTSLLYCVFNNCNFSGCLFGSQPEFCRLLHSVKFNSCGGRISSLTDAFKSCYSLKSISLPDSWVNVNNIERCFSYCETLTYAHLPDSWVKVTKSDSCFIGCKALTEVSLPRNWVNITSASYLFSNCTALKTASIPDSWVNINNVIGVFNGCSSLNNLTLPDTLVNVRDFNNIFSNCYVLTNIDNNGGAFINTPLNITSTVLNKSSILRLLSNLKDRTGSATLILQLGETLLAKLTPEEKAIATNKNWTLS